MDEQQVCPAPVANHFIWQRRAGSTTRGGRTMDTFPICISAAAGHHTHHLQLAAQRGVDGARRQAARYNPYRHDGRPTTLTTFICRRSAGSTTRGGRPRDTDSVTSQSLASCCCWQGGSGASAKPSSSCRHTLQTARLVVCFCCSCGGWGQVAEVSSLGGEGQRLQPAEPIGFVFSCNDTAVPFPMLVHRIVEPAGA